MNVTILLKNGRKVEFANAGVQKKNDGRSTAVYDRTTFRILAEYSVDQISVCESSIDAVSNSRVVGAQNDG